MKVLALALCVMSVLSVAVKQGVDHRVGQDPRGCLAVWIGDGACDAICFEREYQWDGGDCGVYEDVPCEPSMIGNNWCDHLCNNEEHNFDNGDCFNS